MPFDTVSGAGGGGLFVAGLLYAASAMYVTGPLVAERTIAKSGWLQRCSAQVQNEIRTQQLQGNVEPQIGCGDILGSLPPAYRRLLNAFGGNAACNLMDAKKRQQELAARLKRQRLQNEIARAGSRCRCAVSLLIDRKRLPLALYAGSARLIAPPVVDSLASELTTSLHAPDCKAIAGQGGAS